MELKGKKLDEWFMSFQKQKSYSEFPHNENYFVKYDFIAQALHKWVHNEVVAGANSNDHGFLTNHGSDHINTLILRASQFLDKNKNIKLSKFETYVLLLAMHFHDVGNILGRDGHEVSAKEIIDLLGTGIVGQDELIFEFIYDIAKSHKGSNINFLPEREHAYEKLFRPQLLAAILKFADELSENFTRASNINLTLKNIPEESLLFHKYAACINSIIPNPLTREVTMIFHVLEEDLCKEYEMDGSKIHLIDYIYLRTLKTYSERVYCMKFLRPDINFDTVKVTIHIKRADGTKYQNGYVLAEQGIESINMDEVLKMCPELKGKIGINLCKQSTTI
jgi:predicted RNA-binding protein YlqC (UPF0109 family)